MTKTLSEVLAAADLIESMRRRAITMTRILGEHDINGAVDGYAPTDENSRLEVEVGGGGGVSRLHWLYFVDEKYTSYISPDVQEFPTMLLIHDVDSEEFRVFLDGEISKREEAKRAYQRRLAEMEERGRRTFEAALRGELDGSS